MPNYRRYKVEGATYFFTVKTENNAQLFADEAAVRLLGDIMRECIERWPFEHPRLFCFPIVSTLCGHYLLVTPTTRLDGHGSRRSSPSVILHWADLGNQHRNQNKPTGGEASGNVDSGNTRSKTKPISTLTSTTSIGTQ